MGYNNFYEFGFGKGDLVWYVLVMIMFLWLIDVFGFMDNLCNYVFEELVDFDVLEECIY